MIADIRATCSIGQMGSLLPFAATGINVRCEPFAIISQRAKDIVYINATSTRECTFALGFAREYA